jgi:hypothetical protein
MAVPYMTVVVRTERAGRARLREDTGVASAVNSSAEADPLLAFRPERAQEATPSARRMAATRAATPRPRRMVYGALCAATLSCATACIGLVYFRPGEPPPPAVTAAPTGTIVINSRPSGAAVVIDGAVRGTTPIVLSLGAGLHTLELRGRRIGRALPLMIAPGAHDSCDIEMEVESTDTLPVPVASVARSADLSAMPVQVPRGRVATVEVQVPNGQLSISATPWAEALVDGRFVGITPIANLALPIGLHEIVWRHPELGERRQSIALTARVPARVGIDLRQ